MYTSEKTLKQQKEKIRERIKKSFNALSVQYCSTLSQKIQQRFLETNLFLSSESLLIYVAFDKEVATEWIINESLMMKKKVFVPRSLGDGQLAICQIKDFKKDLILGRYSILEPRLEIKPIQDCNDITLFVLPGLAFTRKGERLGRGAGYFDRLFQNEVQGEKMALAYEFQIVPSLPIEKHDQKVDSVLTEANLYRGGK